MTTVADQFVETLALAGVKRIYGIVGDSLNGLTDCHPPPGQDRMDPCPARGGRRLRGRRRGASDRRARGLRRQLRAGQSASHQRPVRLPPLARAGARHRRANSLGRDRQRLFPGDASANAVPGMQPLLRARLRRQPDAARARGRDPRGGRQARRVGAGAARRRRAAGRRRRAAGQGRRAAAARAGRHAVATTISIALPRCSTAASRITILCGSGCQGAHDELLALGERLKAPMVHALRGKEHVEWDNPYDVGMTGLIGFSSGYYAMRDCDVLLMLGTDFPYRQFYPQGDGVRIAQVDLRAENIGRRAAGRSRRRRRRPRDTRGAAAAARSRSATARISPRRSSITPRRARRSTISPSARPASG